MCVTVLHWRLHFIKDVSRTNNTTYTLNYFTCLQFWYSKVIWLKKSLYIRKKNIFLLFLEYFTRFKFIIKKSIKKSFDDFLTRLKDKTLCLIQVKYQNKMLNRCQIQKYQKLNFNFHRLFSLIKIFPTIKYSRIRL